MNYYNHIVQLKNPEMQHKSVKSTRGGQIGNVSISEDKNILIHNYVIDTTEGEKLIPQSLEFNLVDWDLNGIESYLEHNKIEYMKLHKAQSQDFKYVKNLTNDSADVYIYGDIGGKVDCEEIAREIHMLSNMGVKTINEHINSPGGYIINGYSIVGANINSPSKIVTYNDGVCASMAAIILSTGDEVNVYDYSLTMIHNPLLGNVSLDDMEDGSDKEMLKKYRDSLLTILGKRMNKEKSVIVDMLRKEVWLSASETKKIGIADNICKPNRKFKDIKDSNDLFKRVAAVYNQNTIKMEKVLSHFKVENEDEVLDKINQLEDKAVKIEDLETKLVSSKSDLEKVQDELEAVKSEKEEIAKNIDGISDEKQELEKTINEKNGEIMDFILDNAVFNGKIKATDKDELRDNFKNSISALKLVLDKVNGSPIKIKDVINEGVSGNPGNTKSDWGFIEWSKNDPNGLDNIRLTDTALYNELGRKSYGVKWNEV